MGFNSGSVADEFTLHDIYREVCKGLNKCWGSEIHLVVSSEFWKSVHADVIGYFSSVSVVQGTSIKTVRSMCVFIDPWSQYLAQRLTYTLPTDWYNKSNFKFPLQIRILLIIHLMSQCDVMKSCDALHGMTSYFTCNNSGECSNTQVYLLWPNIKNLVFMHFILLKVLCLIACCLCA